MTGNLPGPSGRTHLLVVALNGSSLIQLDQHIDHTANRVTYVADETRAGNIRQYQRVADLVTVADPTDVEGEVFAAVAELFERNGTADAVFTPSEYDLLTAAQIRGKFGIQGMTEAQTLDFRDKVCMKRRVAAAGLAAPRFGECGVRDDVTELLGRIGYPVVLKPRRGMGSRGIHVVHDEAELDRAWELIDPENYEVEEFVTGPIYHVDGLVHNGRLVFSKVSRYLNTCLDTAHNRVPLGSVVIDEEPLRQRLRDFADACLAALSLRNGPFHLETILRDGVEPVFLEVGARAGGGQIRMVFEDVYGIDLIKEWAKLEMLQEPDLPAHNDDIVGGWLVAPAPCPPPYEVARCEPIDGIPCLYYSALPRTGDVYDAARLRQDRWPGGRFRFSGPTTVDVTAAIQATMARHQPEMRRFAEDHVIP